MQGVQLKSELYEGAVRKGEAMEMNGSVFLNFF